MSMKEIGRKLMKAASVALPVMASCGVILTAVLSSKAAIKAEELLKKAEEEKGQPLTKTETVKTAAPLYLPTAFSGLSTIACMIGAYALNEKRCASLLGAYTMVNRMYQKYRETTKKLCGEEVCENIEKEIMKETCKEVNVTAPTFCLNTSLDFHEKDPDEKRLFYDRCSERYFETTIARVLQAEYHLNRNFMLNGFVSLNDFYEFLGLEKTDYGETVGWNGCDGDIYWIDFDHSSVELEDGMECCVIDMIFPPTAEYLENT